jgi:hypothetical protein
MSKIVENDGFRYFQNVSDYAADSEAGVDSIEFHKFEYDGKKKVRFDVLYKIGTKLFPFSYFTRDLPTDKDIELLEKSKVVDLQLQWGRMDLEDDWGKPKVRHIILDGGEVMDFQGGIDAFEPVGGAE